ncbi:MAG TPA: hypothetical protein VJ896_10970 [Bacteroidales bacterium]|nr:hypothetical protein [Bacteroidales bacterium]
MYNSYHWKKRIFSDTYRVYSLNQQTGELRNRTFSASADGEINGKRYTFRTKGFFKQQTEIIDHSDHSVVGKITFNSWMTKAYITINGREYTWKYQNVWNTRWSISGNGVGHITYKGTSTGGQIETSTDDDLLLLTGLYVTNYYRQTTLLVLVAVFVPIIAASG